MAPTAKKKRKPTAKKCRKDTKLVTRKVKGRKVRTCRPVRKRTPARSPVAAPVPPKSPTALAPEVPQATPLPTTSLAAFQADLEARGLADRVLVHVWSEFGRRVSENGTGTDHGAGGTSLLMGSRVKGTVLGEWPGLGSAGVDRSGNVKANVDYRAVYASLAEQWLEVDAAPIVPDAGSFGRYALLK